MGIPRFSGLACIDHFYYAINCVCNDLRINKPKPKRNLCYGILMMSILESSGLRFILAKDWAPQECMLPYVDLDISSFNKVLIFRSYKHEIKRT